ncbi:MAG: FeoA family protein [Erysipelotrichaceae bacterium]|nr:FeoA family protein [Erysipelotrichaceae bacterium]
MTLDELKIGQSAAIIAVKGRGILRHRLLDMGLTPRTKVFLRNMAPMKDPIEIALRGYTLTLRKEEAKNIEVVLINE